MFRQFDAGSASLVSASLAKSPYGACWLGNSLGLGRELCYIILLLCCAVLCCTVLYCTVLCCAVLYCTVLYYTTTVLYYIISYYYDCYTTANLPTNIMDFGGFDSSIILMLRGGLLMSIGNFLESLSQAILVGIMLVGRLGV